MTRPTDRVSKRLALWLRHRPEQADLQLTSTGWAQIDDVLKALTREGFEFDREALAELVAQSDKQRFEVSDDGRRIRARQGHSLQIQGDWKLADPPDRLYHGTVDRFLETIIREGLRPMGRHHVHLSPDMETARRVGGRRGTPVILAVQAGALAASGRPFYVTGNGVWLVEQVPPEYLQRVPDAELAPHVRTR